jgi:hypothetical protein
MQDITGGNMSKIIFDEELDRCIEFYRSKANSREGGFVFTEDVFRHLLFIIGLTHYEEKILPKLTGEPYKPYYYTQGKKIRNLSNGATA